MRGIYPEELAAFNALKAELAAMYGIEPRRISFYPGLCARVAGAVGLEPRGEGMRARDFGGYCELYFAPRTAEALFEPLREYSAGWRVTAEISEDALFSPLVRAYFAFLCDSPKPAPTAEAAALAKWRLCLYAACGSGRLLPELFAALSDCAGAGGALRAELMQAAARLSGCGEHYA